MHDTIATARQSVAATAAHFGEHVTLDGYDGNSELLNNRELLVSCIVELCAMLGMRKLSDVCVLSAPDNLIKDPGGWSGFVVVAESHISIHTFPKRRFVSADVYTCRNGMDVTAITEFFKRKYELKDVEINFVLRGTRYPLSNIT